MHICSDATRLYITYQIVTFKIDKLLSNDFENHFVCLLSFRRESKCNRGNKAHLSNRFS